jgi:hypothetical protein
LWPKQVSGAFLAILLVAAIIALPSLIITTSSQTASASAPSENFTIVALPDTQYYSQSYAWIFENQTEWIVKNENKDNIVFVTHLGDIVEHYDGSYEWGYADIAMSTLDNQVPYGILPGNHDLDGGPVPIVGATAVEYENYFPASRYENYPYWGGSYDSKSVTSSSPNMNNYQLFTWGGMNFITISLQYSPPADVLSWADNVLSKYSNRRAIISTHAYLDTDGSRLDHGPAGDNINGGTAIWENLVVPNKNVFLVLCGHAVNSDTGIGEAEKIDNLGGRVVYQLLSDYQGMRPNGGDGYLRMMEFVPSENTIYVQTYSPNFDNYMTGPSSQFELYYPMGPAVPTNGGISLMVYVGAIIVIVVIIAAVMILRFV